MKWVQSHRLKTVFLTNAGFPSFLYLPSCKFNSLVYGWILLLCGLYLSHFGIQHWSHDIWNKVGMWQLYYLPGRTVLTIPRLWNGYGSCQVSNVTWEFWEAAFVSFGSIQQLSFSGWSLLTSIFRETNIFIGASSRRRVWNIRSVTYPSTLRLPIALRRLHC